MANEEWTEYWGKEEKRLRESLLKILNDLTPQEDYKIEGKLITPINPDAALIEEVGSAVGGKVGGFYQSKAITEWKKVNKLR